MSFLQSVVSIQMGWLVAGAIVAAGLLVLWISTLLSRRWFVTIKKSEETELVAFHIRRIADAVERMASARESQTQSSVDSNATRPIGLGAYGR